jgi:hypothetical protein
MPSGEGAGSADAKLPTSVRKAICDVRMAPRLTFASACFDLNWYRRKLGMAMAASTPTTKVSKTGRTSAAIARPCPLSCPCALLIWTRAMIPRMKPIGGRRNAKISAAMARPEVGAWCGAPKGG